MKRFFAIFLLVFLFSIGATASKDITFSDLPESHWGYSTIMPMVEKGLFNGTSAVVDGVGTFSPDKISPFTGQARCLLPSSVSIR